MAVNWRIFEDPDFQALPEEERRKGFAEVAGSDAEFQALPEEEQLKGYAEIVRPSPIISEPGHPWLQPMTVPVAPPAPTPELVAAHPPVAPEQPLIVRTPRGIESRDIMGRRPPIMGREAALAPITTGERLRRDVAAGLRYGKQVLAAEPFRQASDVLRSYGRFVGIEAEPGEVLAEAATIRAAPPATLAGQGVAFPGEAVAGLAPALEAGALGVTGTPVLGAFLVNRFLREYGAGKPMAEVAAGVGQEALTLGPMVAGAGLAARSVGPCVGAGVERAVSRAVGAGPAEGAMAPGVARVAGTGAERLTRAVGAAVPVYVTAKAQGATDEDALKAAVELGILDLGMGARHPTVRQNLERAVKQAGARAWAAEAMSPERAQVQVTPERPALPAGLMDRIRAAREAPSVPRVRVEGALERRGVTAPPVAPPGPVAGPRLPIDLEPQDAARRAHFRRTAAPPWLLGHRLEEWANGRMSDEEAARAKPSWVTPEEAKDQLGAAAARGDGLYRAASPGEVPPEGWLPAPPEGPTLEGEAPGERGRPQAPVGGARGVDRGVGGPGRPYPPAEAARAGVARGAGAAGGRGAAGAAGSRAVLEDLASRLTREARTPVSSQDFELVDPANPRAPLSAEVELAHRLILEATGQEPLLVRIARREVSDAFDGLFLPALRPRSGGRPGHGGRIVLNVNADAPLTFAAGHELSHEIQYKAPHLAKPVLDVIAEEVDLARWQRETGARVGTRRPDWEFMGDFLGQQIRRQEFWHKLADRAPRAFQELAWRLVNLLDRLIRAVPRQYQAEPYVRDVQRLRDVYTVMLSDYAALRGAGEVKGPSPAKIAARMVELRDQARTERSEDALRDWVREHPIRLPKVAKREGELGGWQREVGLTKRAGTVLEDYAGILKEYRTSNPKAGGPDEALSNAIGAGVLPEGATTNDLVAILQQPAPRWRTRAIESLKGEREAADTDLAMDREQLHEALTEAFERFEAGESPLPPQAEPTREEPPFLRPRRVREAAPEEVALSGHVADSERVRLEAEWVREAEQGPMRLILSDRTLRRSAIAVDLGRVAPTYVYGDGVWVDLSGPNQTVHALLRIRRLAVRGNQVFDRWGVRASFGEAGAGEPAFLRPRRESRWLPGMEPEGQRRQAALFGAEEGQLEPLVKPTVPEAPPAQGRGQQRGLFEGEEREVGREEVEARRRAYEAETGQLSLAARLGARAREVEGARAVRAETGRVLPGEPAEGHEPAGGVRRGAGEVGVDLERPTPGQPGGGAPRAERPGPITRAAGKVAGAEAREEPWRETLNAFVDRRQRGPMNPGLFELKNIHAEEVRRAVQEGEAVPPEVLADYPDLAIEGLGRGVEELAAGARGAYTEGEEVSGVGRAVRRAGEGEAAERRPAVAGAGGVPALDEAARAEARRRGPAALPEPSPASAAAADALLPPPVKSGDPIAELRAVEQRAGGGRQLPPGTQSASRALSEKGGLALVGHTVKDMEQLAGVAQVLRDPRIETLRLFLVDAEGKILAQTAVTSRLPGHSWIWPRGMTEIRWMNRLERQMERLGATGYYVLHNHPSGDPLPSMADVQVTRAYAERLPGLLGHVVINDVAYGLIETPKRDSTTGRLIKPTPYIVPLRPEDVVRVERGRAAQGFEAPEDVPGSITSPQELAAYGKVVQRRLDRGLTVVYADSAGRALWVAEFRAEAALRGKEFEDQLLGLARSVGGFQAVAVVRRPSPEIESALVEAMQHGCFRDVWVEGTAADPNDAYSFQQRNVRPFAQAVYGRNIRAIQEGTRSVQEPGPEEREGQAFFLRRRRLADEASARLFDEEIVADLKARHEADVERQRAARAEAEAEGGEPRGAPRGVRFTGPLPGGKAPTEAMEQGTLRRVAGKLKDEGVALGRFLAVTIPQGEFVFPSPERLFRSLGPAGEELFQRGEWAKTNGEKYGSELSDPLWLAWKDLDRSERKWLRDKFVWAYEDRKPMPTSGLVKFAEAYRAAVTWIGDKAEDLGLMVTPGAGGEPRPFAARDPATYVPHRLTGDARDALRNRRGRIYQRLIEEAKARGIPAEVLWELINPPLVTKRHGSLEHPRLADLPRTIQVEGKTVKVLEDDPSILGQHIISATRRLAIIEQFGQEGNTKYLQELAERMVAHGMDADQAEHMIPLVWRRLQGAQRPGNPFMTTRWRTLWNAVEALAAGTNLSLAVVPNLFGGYLPLMIRHGVVPATRGFIHAWTTAIGSADETRIRRLAYLHQDLMRPLTGRDLLAGMPITETIERLPARVSSRVLRTTGFQLANRKINQGTAWNVDHFLLDSALQSIRESKSAVWGMRGLTRDAETARRYLVQQLGFSKGDVERMAFGEPTEADVSRAMQKEIENVNAINESAMARPPHIDNTLWRLVMAYTTYIRKFGKTSEYAAKEFPKGNVGPLMRLLFVGPVTGAAIIAARNFLKDRKREEGEWYDPAALYSDLVEVGAFGLWSAVDYGVRHFGEFGHEFFPDVFNPPQTETLNRVATGLARAWRQGKLRPLFQNLAFAAPILDVAEKQFRRYDPDYIAERLSRMVYTGRTVTRGRQREPLEPIPGRENTAKMLLERWRKMGRSDEELLERIRALRARPAEVVGE